MGSIQFVPKETLNLTYDFNVKNIGMFSGLSKSIFDKEMENYVRNLNDNVFNLTIEDLKVDTTNVKTTINLGHQRYGIWASYTDEFQHEMKRQSYLSVLMTNEIRRRRIIKEAKKKLEDNQFGKEKVGE